MEISLDTEADALYIRLVKGKFAKNKKVDPDTILDLDARGRVLGIEMLNFSKRVPAKNFTRVKVKLPLKAVS